MVEEVSGNQGKQDGGQATKQVPEPGAQSFPPPSETIFVEDRPLPDQSSGQRNAGTATKQEENALEVVEEAMKPFERMMVRLTWVGIGVAAITGVIFYTQLGEMSRQTQILASQGEPLLPEHCSIK
jgi:hypothetical protein